MSEPRRLTEHESLSFREKILSFYRDNRRSFPWRETGDPYRIFVSEIMLQQTQTERVLPKYMEFTARLPDFQTCADVSTETLFSLWKGLGYNRRALALRETSRIIVRDYGGNLPANLPDLIELPGIGPGTAGALLAFAFHRPSVFIETNIRRVFIHEFFTGTESVHDSLLFPLIEATLDRGDPRNWYYALMDYGVMLKKSVPNPNRKSRHYVRQSTFRNSNRQIRGGILRVLSEAGELPREKILALLPFPGERVDECLSSLEAEGFIVCEQTVRFRERE